MNFNENSYTVTESDGEVNVSLRIDGQFFVPVWAVVDISDGTATGGLCMLLGLNIYKHRLLTKLLATLNSVCAYQYYVCIHILPLVLHIHISTMYESQACTHILFSFNVMLDCRP